MENAQIMLAKLTFKIKILGNSQGTQIIYQNVFLS